jgi:transcription elongation factor SPT4
VPSPAKTRQDSQSPQQSAARREALARLFDDDSTDIQDRNQLVPPVEHSAALPLTDLLNCVPSGHKQASLCEYPSQSTTPAEELPASPKPVLDKNFPVQKPARIAYGTLCHPPSNAYSVRPPKKPAPTDNHGNMANASNFIPTNQHRHMRACMICSIVKTLTQFKNMGCPNCEAFLQLRGSDDAIQECTSQVFEGLITVSDTSKSWVARWQRLEGYVPGVYAVQVEGVLPDEVVTAAEESGIHYIPRDGSVNEALPTEKS